MLAEAGTDILAFTSFPGAHWKQVWSNNPQERLNKEITAQDRRGGHLPEPARGASADRRCTRRTARRVGGRQTIPDARLNDLLQSADGGSDHTTEPRPDLEQKDRRIPTPHIRDLTPTGTNMCRSAFQLAWNLMKL